MRFIDIAANLTDPVFQGLYHSKQCHSPDLTNIISRGTSVGITHILITGTSLSSSHRALALTSFHPSFYSTVGVHPTESSDWNDSTFNSLLSLFSFPNCHRILAIGECGLDYDRLQFSPKHIQIPVFEHQFQLAQQTGLPMFLHCRNTGNDFLEVVTRNRTKFSTGVVHSFTGTAEEAKEYIKLGLYIGVNGCSLKTEESLIVVKALPLDRIMVETDCPWCEIRPSHAGYKFLKQNQRWKWEEKKKEKWEEGALVKGRNEVCKIAQVLEVLCGLKVENWSKLREAKREEERERIAEILYDNAKKVFFNKAVS